MALLAATLYNAGMSPEPQAPETVSSLETPYRPDVRAFIRSMEVLAPGQFILLVGFGAGLLQGVPAFLLAGSTANRAILAVTFAGLSLLSLAGAVLVWWIAVHRRQFSYWRTAWHLTLALALGDLLAAALALVDAFNQSNGEYISLYVNAPLSTTMPSLLAPILLRSPFRLLGSALLVALGRSLHEAQPPMTERPRLSGESNAVT